MLSIHHCRTEDHDQLRLLAHALYNSELPPEGELDVEDPVIQNYFNHLLRLQASEHGAILVAKLDERLVGFVCVMINIVPEGKDTGVAYAFLSDLYVQPGLRRQGVGTQLTTHAERYAREQGAGRMALKVLSANRDAVDFYRRQAYRERFVIMEKPL